MSKPRCCPITELVVLLLSGLCLAPAAAVASEESRQLHSLSQGPGHSHHFESSTSHRALRQEPVWLRPGGFRVALEDRFRSPLVMTVPDDFGERSASSASVPRALRSRATRSTSLSLVIRDDPGEGFNDPTPADPIAGNTGTTLGEQRIQAFEAAAAQWAAVLHSEIPIRVGAALDPLFCNVSEAILGEAGPTETYRDFFGAPRASTWYPAALANALAVFDLTPAGVEIEGIFNSAVDSNGGCLGGSGWWYGLDQAAPPGQPDFFATVLHELAHGLGFVTFVDLETGALLEGYEDTYMLHLLDDTLQLAWSDMSNSERVDSATEESHLVWTGPSVVARAQSLSTGVNEVGQVWMYAPSLLAEGSSVVHFDPEVGPSELMEPSPAVTSRNVISLGVLEDIGWTLVPNVPLITTGFESGDTSDFSSTNPP